MSAAEEELALQLRALKLPPPIREYRFDSVRRWRFDFAWPALMLAVEVEGGIHSRGRHVRPQGFEKDCEKYNAAALAGWTVLRVTTAMVTKGLAIDLIGRAIRDR